MALEISSNTQTLTLKGTSITFNTVYSRLELACFPDGKSMQVAFHNYQDVTAFSAGNSTIKLEGIANNSMYSVDVVGGETQSLQLAHEKARDELQALGYTVSIIDL